MKVKDLIKKLQQIEEEKKIQIIDTNDNEYNVMSVSEDDSICEIWIE